MIFDEVFKYIGGYGRYQQLITHIICCISITHSLSNIGTVFLNGFMDHYCTIPDNPANCSRADYQCGITSFSFPPDNENTAFVNETKCKMYKEVGDGNETLTDINCEHGWTYDTSQYKSSIVSEFDLVCKDSYKVSLAASSFLLGYFFGSIVFGTFCDYFGRKIGMIFTLLLKILTGIVLSLSPSYWFYFVFRVLNGAATIGSHIAMFVYVAEMVEPSRRAAVSAFNFLYWSCGFFVIAVFAFLLRGWRTFYLTISLCPVPMIFVYFLFPESPRWLLLQSKEQKAKSILQMIAKKNGLNLTEDVFEKIEVHRETHGRSKRKTFFNIFRYPNMRNKTLILVYCWFTVCLVYYGLIYGVEGLDVNVYVGMVISGIIQCLAVVFGLISIQKIGRRFTLVFLFIVAGILAFINIWIPPYFSGLRTGISIAGQFFSLAIFYVVYIYSSELYSTDVRSFGLGLCSFTARIAGILAPQILFLQNFWEHLPLVAFSVTSVSAGILALFLPETLGFPLPQTLEEANLVTRSTNSRDESKGIELTAD